MAETVAVTRNGDVRYVPAETVAYWKGRGFEAVASKNTKEDKK